MSARAAGLRALDLAPRLIPETRFAEDRKFRPLFTVATLLCFGTTFLPLMRAVPRGMDSIVWIPFVLLGLAFLFFMLIQRVSKWAMPSSLHLVPGLRVDLGLTVALHWLAISLFASGVLLNFVTFGYYAAALPILLLALVLDLPASRLRTLIWALAIAAAAVLYVAAMSARPGVRILGSADLHSIEYGVGLWLVVATALAMVGLVYVKPLSTVGLSIIWIWLMKDPHALVFFNFNEVLKLTYATSASWERMR